MKKIIAITSCPVGVAHTYMAAEKLEQAGADLGVNIKVETHGSVGIENALTTQEIKEAEGLIIATDTEIDKSRFSGKQIIEVGVQDGIRRPEELITDVLNHKGVIYEGTAKATESDEGGSTLYRSLMNGVSYMVPFVVTGGLLIAVALTIGGTPTEAGLVVPEDSFWMHILRIGEVAMGYMVPILAGYIAMSIADRPGLVPGMIGGYIAINGSFYGSEANTGFIGGIIAGFLAGYIALIVRRLPVPRALNAIMPIIVIPIVSSILVGLSFIFLIGLPIAELFTSLTDWLASMQGASSVVLATIIGAMIAFDMGGPFNKVAFLFGSGLIAEGTYSVMGAVAVAVSVPPIGLGLASHLLKNKFSDAERQTGTAALTMGFFGITEGAIPFAASDPIRVIPSIIGGSIAGSIVAMLSGVGDRVAHGGPIVALLGAVDNVFMYFVALAIGVTVTVILLAVLRQDSSKGTSTIESSKKTEVLTETNEEFELNNLIQLTDKSLIELNLKSNNKTEAIKELVNLSGLSRHIKDKDAVVEALYTRESQGTTGLGEGVAIPHAKSEAITIPTVLFGRSETGIDWQSLDDQDANLVFMILVPEAQKGDTHLTILQMLSRKLMDDNFKESLLEANSKAEILDILKEVKVD